MHFLIKDLINISFENFIKITIKGWIKNKRISKNIIFLDINDGSCIENMQVVLDENIKFQNKDLQIGSSLEIEGLLKKSLVNHQKNELEAKNCKILGESSEIYPIQPKKHSFEFLRSIPNLRIRTSTFGAIFRIRSSICFAIHDFFRKKKFFNYQSPIITTTDGEGAGEMFNVSSLNFEDLMKKKIENLDFSSDFFSEKANLTVTGQLEAETAIFGLNRVYTFGPTFRAENSNTTRHLAEFWMIEPEAAFFNLEDNILLATDLLKFVINFVLENNFSDLFFLQKRKKEDEKAKKNDLDLIDFLKTIVEKDFQRITYSQAIEILKNEKYNFEKKINDWGDELQSEHERFLVENYFKNVTVVTDYPKQLKAFYMRQNEDKKTVAAMDILVPCIGEIIGGSQREERLDFLLDSINFFKINQDSIKWYIETRKFGSIIHSGFGLGLERLVMLITGIENIRDVIAFPRFSGSAKNQK
jgi:asparaginyl-tRNA synthetase